MLTTIDLDDQLCRMAEEVADVAPDGGLTAELTSFDLLAAKQAPKFSLRVGRVLS